MEINCTLLVQAVHFVIVYWLLRLLLFKPGLAIIFQEQEDQFAAHRALQEHEQKLEHARSKVDKAWRQCKTYFAEHAPKKIEDNVTFFRGIVPEVMPPKIDPIGEEQHAKKVDHAIVKKVRHVH